MHVVRRHPAWTGQHGAQARQVRWIAKGEQSVCHLFIAFFQKTLKNCVRALVFRRGYRLCQVASSLRIGAHDHVFSRLKQGLPNRRIGERRQPKRIDSARQQHRESDARNGSDASTTSPECAARKSGCCIRKPISISPLHRRGNRKMAADERR
jgi:hypothetical protein